MSYAYMTPHEAYANRRRVEGRPAGLAYWVNGNLGSAEVERTATQEYGRLYDFSLKMVERIEPGLHAFRLVFADGQGCEELSSYDKVCVRW